MFKKTILAAVTIAAIALTGVTPANAFDLGSAARGGFTKQLRMQRGGSTPIAYQIYCLQNLNECRPGGNKNLSYTSKVRATLASVNRAVNRSIKPLNERRDVWSLNPTYGDCDDYVMTKRSLLIRAGIPAGALRVAVVRTQRGIGHAVLVVKTSAGEFVLDNLRSNILKRSQSGYKYLKIASADPMRWTK